MAAVVRALVEQGEVEELTGERAEEQGDVKYRRVAPVPQAVAPERKGKGRPTGVHDGCKRSA